MTDLHDIWQKATVILRSTLNVDTYERSIAHIVPVRCEEKAIVLGVSYDIFCEWLVANYKDIIAEALHKATGQKWKIVFESGHTMQRQPEAEADAAAAGACQPPSDAPEVECPLPEQASPAGEAASRAGRGRPGLPSATPGSGSGFNSHYTFDTFVVGDNSRFAHGACLAIAASPGTAYNPLFIHSPTGLGKTHLLHAVAQDALRRFPKARVEYICSEEFCNQYIDALIRKSLPNFRNRFRNVDVLLIDDIHFLGGKEGIQEEFFHTFNALYNGHKQIVVASDRPPHEIGGLEKRLVSRFEWGLTTDIQVPNLETRIAILHKKQLDHAYKIPEEVLHYIALRLKSSIRRLEGALIQLVSYSSLSGGSPVTVGTAEQLLCNLFNEEAGAQITVEQIQRAVADYYDIRIADMTSKRRPANIAMPRQVAMFLARKLTDLSLPAIAEHFNRNHATVIHAIDSIKDKQAGNQVFQREIALIERKLKSL